MTLLSAMLLQPSTAASDFTLVINLLLVATKSVQSPGKLACFTLSFCLVAINSCTLSFMAYQVPACLHCFLALMISSSGNEMIRSCAKPSQNLHMLILQASQEPAETSASDLRAALVGRQGHSAVWPVTPRKSSAPASVPPAVHAARWRTPLRRRCCSPAGKPWRPHTGQYTTTGLQLHMSAAVYTKSY